MKLTGVAVWIAAGLFSLPTRAGVCQSQTLPTGRPVFETAAVHQDDPAGNFHTTRVGFFADGLRVDHASVRTLIASAYDLDEDQIEGGPPWIESDSYDIVATYGETRAAELRNTTSDARRELQRQMLINLLSDRFGLQIELSQRKAPIYEVVVSKGGTKLRPSSRGNTYRDGLKDFEGAPVGSGFVGYRFVGGAVDIPAQAGHIGQLIQRLNANARPPFLDRKIVDRTGLTGAYDFDLTFSVPWIGHIPNPSEIEASDGNTGHTLSDSLREQLGLELHPSTGSLRVLIVKALDRPSEN